jgi:hypothetical protein
MSDQEQDHPTNSGAKMTIRFEPRDVWIGWFWDRRDDGTHHYVCLLPMLVIHWVVRPKRTCWIYCPECHHDLNGDSESYQFEWNASSCYLCANCGQRSAFDLEPPVPIHIGVW